VAFLGCCTIQAHAQSYSIRGIVYDSSRTYPLGSVSVSSTGGSQTITNEEGYYEIRVTEKDSIWFSYMNKPTVKFPTITISNPMQFDISLQVSIPILKEVKVYSKDYKLDSIRNRQDYAKVFDFRKPGLRLVPAATSGVGVAFDLNEIINVFRFRRTQSLLSFQQRLLQEERERYIDFRFNKALVRRLTELEGAELDKFMSLFRPSYLFTKLSGDYDFRLYIKQCHERYTQGLPPLTWQEPLWQ